MCEKKLFGKYQVVNKIVDKNNFLAYVCHNTSLPSDNLFMVNVYKDNKVSKELSKFFGKLKFNNFNDYIECFNYGDSLCAVFKYNQNILLKDYLVDNLVPPTQRKEYVLDIVKLIITLSEIMPEALLNKLISFENLYYNAETKTFGFYYIFDYSDSVLYTQYSDIISKTGTIIEDIFYGCVINSKPFLKYIKKLKSGKYLTSKELMKATQKIVKALNAKNTFDEKLTEKMRLYVKYKDILEDYIPCDINNKKTNKFNILVVFIFLIIIACFAYIIFLPNKMFFNMANQEIIDWFNNLYTSIYSFLAE